MNPWATEFELTIASGPSDPTGLHHILIFRDPSELDTWDVANCGASLGDWDAFDLLHEGPIQSVALCRRCFESGVN